MILKKWNCWTLLERSSHDHQKVAVELSYISIFFGISLSASTLSGYWGKRFYWKKCKVCSAKDVPKISENCIPKIMYWNLEVCHFLSKSTFLVFSYYMMLFSYIYIKKYNLLGKIRVKIGQAEQKMEKHVRFSHILTIFDV